MIMPGEGEALNELRAPAAGLINAAKKSDSPEKRRAGPLGITKNLNFRFPG